MEIPAALYCSTEWSSLLQWNFCLEVDRHWESSNSRSRRSHDFWVATSRLPKKLELCNTKVNIPHLQLSVILQVSMENRRTSPRGPSWGSRCTAAASGSSSSSPPSSIWYATLTTPWCPSGTATIRHSTRGQSARTPFTPKVNNCISLNKNVWSNKWGLCLTQA